MFSRYIILVWWEVVWLEKYILQQFQDYSTGSEYAWTRQGAGVSLCSTRSAVSTPVLPPHLNGGMNSAQGMLFCLKLFRQLKLFVFFNISIGIFSICMIYSYDINEFVLVLIILKHITSDLYVMINSRREGILGCLLHWSQKFYNDVFIIRWFNNYGDFYWILNGWFIELSVQTLLLSLGMCRNFSAIVISLFKILVKNYITVNDMYKVGTLQLWL